MKNIFCTAIIIFSLVMSPIAAVAQVAAGGNFTLEQSVIAGGGGQSSTGGTFSLDGTIGQSVAGDALIGSPFALTSGFWNSASLAAPNVIISGQVTGNGNPLVGVTVALSGSMSNTALTDSAGNYQFTVPRNGTYTVTPSLANYTFTPPNASFTSINSNQTANFVATPSCIESLNPESANVGSAASTGTIAVTAPAGCNWTASTTDNWITITAGSNGTGNGTVSYSIAQNSGTARTGTITIGGQIFTINQAAGGSFTISGVVSYGTTPVGNPIKYVSDVLLTASGSGSAFATTNSTGDYSLSSLVNGSYTVTPSKTAQTDNNGISLQDASEVAKYVFNQRTFTPSQLIAADATGNGTVSLQDASEIAKRAFNISSTNIVGQWKFSPATRSYPNISANLSGENYQAILIGDVTGNWTPPSANRPEEETAGETAADEKAAELFVSDGQQSGLPVNNHQAKDQPSAETVAGGIPVSLPNQSGSSNTTVLIPVTVGDLTAQNITSYELTIRFDPTILEVASPAFETSGTLTGAAGGYSVFVDPTQATGTLRVGAFGTASLSGSGTLIFLRFNVLAGAAATTALEFIEFKFGESGMPDSATTNGMFMRFGPTAAAAIISGQVVTTEGRAVSRAKVSITNQNGESRIAVTNPFGYYRFIGVAAGQTYVINAVHKQYTFNSQVLSVNGNLSEVNHIAADRPNNDNHKDNR